jgi:deoxyribonuclease-2
MLLWLTCYQPAGARHRRTALPRRVNNCLQYAYVDPATSVPAGPLVVTGTSLDCGRGCALGATLTQLLGSGASSVAALMWNDEVPTPFATGPAAAAAGLVGNASNSGHTKGVVGVDGAGGFWLTHSVPLFPVLTGSVFAWNNVSDTYGQTFLCVSVNASSVDTVAAGLQYIDPMFFGSRIPAPLAAKYPALTALLAGQRATGSIAQPVGSAGGQPFIHFAKSGSSGLDLYEAVVQPALQADALWETWRRSPVQATLCRPQAPWDSINVNELAFVTPAGKAVPFDETQDHSKWGVTRSASAASQWLCVGDINRMTSQFVLGGGTVCTRYAPLYRALNATITGADSCPTSAAAVGALPGGARLRAGALAA